MSLTDAPKKAVQSKPVIGSTAAASAAPAAGNDLVLGKKPEEIAKLAITHYNAAADIFNQKRFSYVGDDLYKCIYLLKELYKYYFAFKDKPLAYRQADAVKTQLNTIKNRLVRAYEMLAKAYYRENKFTDSMKTLTHAIMWSDMALWLQMRYCGVQEQQPVVDAISAVNAEQYKYYRSDAAKIDVFIDLFAKSKAKARLDLAKSGQNGAASSYLFCLADILKYQKMTNPMITEDIILAISDEEFKCLKYMEARYRQPNACVFDKLHILDQTLPLYIPPLRAPVRHIINKEILECSCPHSSSTTKKLLNGAIFTLSTLVQNQNLAPIESAVLHAVIGLFEQRVSTMMIQEYDAVLSAISSSGDHSWMRLVYAEVWSRVAQTIEQRFSKSIQILEYIPRQYLGLIHEQDAEMFDFATEITELTLDAVSCMATDTCRLYTDCSNVLVNLLDVVASKNSEPTAQAIARSKIILHTSKQWWMRVAQRRAFYLLPGAEEISRIRTLLDSLKLNELRQYITDPLEVEDVEEFVWKARYHFDIALASLKLRNLEIDSAKAALEAKLQELLQHSKAREGRRDLIVICQNFLSVICELKNDTINALEYAVMGAVILGRLTASSGDVTVDKFAEYYISYSKSERGKKTDWLNFGSIGKFQGMEMAYSMLSVGNIYEGRGNVREANFYFIQALHLALYAMCPPLVYKILLAMGDLELKRSCHDAAEKLFRLATDFRGHSPALGHAYLSRLFLLKRDIDLARQHLMMAETELQYQVFGDGDAAAVVRLYRCLVELTAASVSAEPSQAISSAIECIETILSDTEALQQVSQQTLSLLNAALADALRAKQLQDGWISFGDRVLSLLADAVEYVQASSISSVRPIYNAVASATWFSDPKLATGFALSSVGMTLRHYKIAALAQRMKASSSREPGMPMDLSQSFNNGNTYAASTNNTDLVYKELEDFHFEQLGLRRSYPTVVDKVQALLPVDMITCSITISSDWYSLVLTRMYKDRRPLVMEIPLFRKNCELGWLEYVMSRCDDSSERGYQLLYFKSHRSSEEGQNALYLVMHEFHNVLQDSERSMARVGNVKTNKERKDWWDERYRLEERLKNVINAMENVVLGGWKGFLLGPLISDTIGDSLVDTDKLEIAASLLTSDIDSLLHSGIPETNRQFVDILLSSLPYLSEEELVGALRTLVDWSLKRARDPATAARASVSDDELRIIAMKFYKLFADTINQSKIISGTTKEVMSEVAEELDGLDISTFVTVRDRTRQPERARQEPGYFPEDDSSSMIIDLEDDTEGFEPRRYPSGTLIKPRKPAKSQLDSSALGFGSRRRRRNTQNYEVLASKMRNTKRKHVVLVLDRFIQGLPWESTPAMRSHSVSRVPSLHLLVSLLRRRNMQPGGYILIEPASTYYVLNPGGDLVKTQREFESWFSREEGWYGVVNAEPSQHEVLKALQTKDLYVFMGHNAGEKFCKPEQVRNLDLSRGGIKAALLMGCSSGFLKDQGSEYEPTGTALSYLLAGCPCVVANLWNVTDKDCDRFSRSLIEGWMTGCELDRTNADGAVVSGATITEVMTLARNTVKLHNLMGAAPVCYGIPVYCMRRSRSGACYDDIAFEYSQAALLAAQEAASLAAAEFSQVPHTPIPGKSTAFDPLHFLEEEGNMEGTDGSSYDDDVVMLPASQIFK